MFVVPIVLHFAELDISIGKIDKHLLSQQDIMEILIEEIECKDRILPNILTTQVEERHYLLSLVIRFLRWLSVEMHPLFQSILSARIIDPLCDFNSKKKEILSDEPPDISHWIGVALNDNKEVVDVNWNSRGLKGIIRLQWIPTTVIRFSVEKNDLHGSADLAALPVSIKVLRIDRNIFACMIDLCHLPEKMEMLVAEVNAFSGKADLCNLPESMKGLSLAFNNLLGTVDLEHLPSLFVDLRLNNNLFTGTISLLKLPATIETLDLSNNGFSGTTDCSKLPESLITFDIFNTQISFYLTQDRYMELLVQDIVNKEVICGTHDLSLLQWEGLVVNEKMVIAINWKSFELAGSLNAHFIPPSVETVCMTENFLTGLLVLGPWMLSLRELRLNKNMFVGEIFLERLPYMMEVLDISENELSGSLRLQYLPSTLKYLSLSNNNFSGSVHLTELPEGLIHLDIAHNQLQSTVDLTRLPNEIQSIYLESNLFCGDTDLSNLPYSVHILNVSQTDLILKNRSSEFHGLVCK